MLEIVDELWWKVCGKCLATCWLKRGIFFLVAVTEYFQLRE